jgi:hypothetical protein
MAIDLLGLIREHVFVDPKKILKPEIGNTGYKNKINPAQWN